MMKQFGRSSIKTRDASESSWLRLIVGMVETALVRELLRKDCGRLTMEVLLLKEFIGVRNSKLHSTLFLSQFEHAGFRSSHLRHNVSQFTIHRLRLPVDEVYLDSTTFTLTAACSCSLVGV